MGNLGIFGAFLWLVIVFGSIAAWITHIVVTITAHAWILLAVGALIPPVGVIHGIMCWFGVPAV